jgi:phosphonate transport system ATP-binding protein
MIQLHDVAVRYGDFTALHPTSLSFVPGQFTVLLGASGAGKSTLLRSLNLLTRPSAGRLSVDGVGTLDHAQRLHEHRKRTGMIFQQHQLIGRQSVLANVLLGRIGYHPAWRTLFPLARGERRVALECLERVGLLHKALERVDCLSGGQQQRVGIARALAQQPRLILADEPVASLDPASARQVLAQLHRFCREDGITTVVSLHQVELAREYADRIIGLSNGRVVFDSTSDALTPERASALYEQRMAPAEPAARVPSFPSPVFSS